VIYCKGELMVEYEVIDTMGNQKIGVYETREVAIKAIRLYCVDKMMNAVSLFNQDFVTLSENGNEITYENPIGYYPIKPKFIINNI
tara:strand:+ start:1800 stop:2057 length:258 start_codon:yes stop_codon:yes gene_type:complete